ncbi:hypothetical protein [Streptomyces sp. NPDC021356]|uniref:hypothetical protein n=1 Tax=Streptomyces sp. NPDC021356 TaxID=3154900 RepID=UPI0033EC0EAE
MASQISGQPVAGAGDSVLVGKLAEREAAARVRAEGLLEEAARPAGALGAAENELDRLTIAREELIEALAVSAPEATVVTGTGTGSEADRSR